MKKYSNAIFVVFLIIFAAGLWLFNSNITRVPLLSDDNFYFVKAKVVEVVEDNTVNKEVNGGSQNVKVEITSGKYKGKICEANNMNGYLYGTYCKKGTNVIVQLSSYGDELSGSIYGYDRGNFIWLIVAVLGAALFLVGGKRGLKSMLALVFTFDLHYLLIHSADVHRCLSLLGSSRSGDRGDDCFDYLDLRKYKKRNLCYDGNDIRRTDRRHICDSVWKNNQNHRL